MSNRRNRTRFPKAWELRLDSGKLSGFFYVQNTTKYEMGRVGFVDIARNVFVLPNTDFSNRLVRGTP